MTGAAACQVNILNRQMVLVGSAEGLKEIFQTKLKTFPKDLDFSYEPFLPILGSGLVTSNGDHWQRQRLLMVTSPPAQAGCICAVHLGRPLAINLASCLVCSVKSMRTSLKSCGAGHDCRAATHAVLAACWHALPWYASAVLQGTLGQLSAPRRAPVARTSAQGIPCSEHLLSWAHGRGIMQAPTLRVEILATVVALTTQALQRLAQLLEDARASGRTVDIEEEFRLMTLQIIGGAALSMDPQECNEARLPCVLHSRLAASMRALHADLQ